MTTNQQQFTVSMRFFHWLVAAMVLTVLGIGVAMIASLADYQWLVSVHRPLGILILILVVIRFLNRQFSTMPPFPATMSTQERFIAHESEILLYTLLFVQRSSAGRCCPRRAIRSYCMEGFIFSPSFRIA